MHRIGFSILFCSLLFAPLNGVFPAQASTFSDVPQYRLGELLVTYEGSDEVHKITIDPSLDIDQVIEQYQAMPGIATIESNATYRVTAFPDDPHYSRQYYLDVVNARQAWSKELLVTEQEGKSSRSVVAILDTGVDMDHPDLIDRIWRNPDEVPSDGIDNDGNGLVDDMHGYDFIDGDNDMNPDLGGEFNVEAVNHGTIVAGITAASGHNGQGIAGVSWNTDIMVLRVLDSLGTGDAFDVVRAIDYAIEQGADVINMSFVGTTYSQSLFNAIRRAYDAGVIVVVAAGNTDPAVNGQNLDVTEHYPVCYDDDDGTNLVLGVASVDRQYKKSRFSNYGKCIDVIAPGEEFYSTEVYQAGRPGFTNYYGGLWSGTSVSSPIVSGMTGLIRSLRPNLSPAQVMSAIIDTASSVDSFNPSYRGKLGSGMVNVALALDSALGQRAPAAQDKASTYYVAGLGYGVFPQVKVLTNTGEDFKSFYAYSPHFTGGINIAVGDVNGDGNQEIITGAGTGGGPHVRVYSIEGILLNEFFAHNATSRAGVRVAAADINSDGVDEIITSAGPGDYPYVRIYNHEGEMLSEFLAYAEGFTGGVHIAVGDINADGANEIVTGAGAGGGPHVRIFRPDGSVVSQFFAYNKNFSGGVRVAVGNVISTNQAHIIASIEKNSVPTVRIFDFRGAELGSFFAYEPNYLNGITVQAADTNSDGLDEIITAPNGDATAELRIFDRRGTQLSSYLLNGSNYQFGATTAVLYQ